MANTAPRELRNLVGRERSELPTPALILDHKALLQNIGTMADWTRGHAAVRPHAKVHKCPEIARLQMKAGAVGITTATVWEALAMVEAGVDRVLVANEIGDPKLARLAADAARRAQVAVAVDDLRGVATLSDAASQARSELEILIEVDIGMTRGGVRSIVDALAIAHEVRRFPRLTLLGVMGWEGQTAIERDRQKRAANAAVAIETLLTVVDALVNDGFKLDVVSAGGTNTFDLTGKNPRVTDIQAGTYAVMDTSYAAIAPQFRPVLSVVGTVLSRHGDRAVLDCGTKVQATTDLAPPQLIGYEGDVFELHEEHALLHVPSLEEPQLGDRVELLVSYASGTVNLHEFYLVCEGDQVVDVWPIVARGPATFWSRQ